MPRNDLSRWERQLRAEGHAADYALGADATKLPGLPVTDEEIAAGTTTGHARHLVGGEAEIERRAAVLHACRFRSSQERQIWQLYAEGYGTREIAKQLNIKRHVAMRTVDSVEERTKEANAKPWKLETLVRQCDPRTLVLVAAALIRAQRRTRTHS